MRAAGCVAIEFGADSGSDEILRNMRKPFSVKEMIRASDACASAGIRAAWYLVFGAPGETERTVGETFSVTDRFSRDVFIALTGIRIYPGTGLYGMLQEEGRTEENLLEPKFYVSPSIPEDRLMEMIAEHATRRRRWIVPSLGLNTDNELIPRLRALDKRGPLWDVL
jgi:radical SAM superfamily enzyme YgiQ (UPF0313 family)